MVMSNPLATIHPNDIETFTILKDASSTAIYGSRAPMALLLLLRKKDSLANREFLITVHFPLVRKQRLLM